jgi:hypothetical protein
MADELGRVHVVLTGFTGAPGLMYFHWQGSTPGVFSTADATAAVAAVRTFLNANVTAFGAGVTLQVQSPVDVINWITGALVRIEAATGVTQVVGTGTGNVLIAEGPLIQWITQTVLNRRLLRGRTFMTPAATGAIGGTGAVAAGIITTMVAAGNALIGTASVQYSCWHRPKPFKTGNNGTVAAIVACTVPQKVAVLRSRRD